MVKSRTLLHWQGLAKNHQWNIMMLLLLCFAVNFAYFRRNYFPVHDTLSVYQFFSYYYDQLINLRLLPWWLPECAYGMPIDSYLLFCFGPFQYFVLVLGYLFNIHNTLVLFSVSLVGDTLFFALGCYFFCYHLYKNKLITLCCVTAILLLVQYDRQIYWNFKILLALPLSLYWTQLGIERFNLGYFFLSLANLLCWSFGSIPYVLPVQFYTVVCYGLVLVASKLKPANLSMSAINQLLAQYHNNLKQSHTRLISLVGMTVIASCLAMMYTLRKVMTEEMAYHAGGRNTNFGVNLDTYLNYGGYGGTEKLTEMFSGIPTSDPHDFLAFIGIVNFIFIARGLCTKQKNTSQWALVITAFVLLAFTVVGTGVATLAYGLPGMSMVRHVAYFITLPKLLLLVLAGFGIQAYVQESYENRLYKLLPLCISLACLLGIPHLEATNHLKHFSTHAIHIAWATLACSLVYCLIPIKTRWFVFLLLGISLIEMFTNRITIYRRSDLFLAPFPATFTHVRTDNEYHATRTNIHKSSFFQYKDFDVYGIAASYLHEDSCPAERQDVVSTGVKKLFDARKQLRSIYPENPRGALYPREDQVLERALGCNTHKLRLVSQVQLANNPKQALSLAQNSDIYTKPVITTYQDGSSTTNTFHRHPNNSIATHDFSANALHITVENNSQNRAWLIYNDAYNKHWHAFIDGQQQPIYPANIAFKAVPINPGKHEVSFIFQRVALGYILFAVMMITIAGLILGFTGCSLLPIPKRMSD